MWRITRRLLLVAVAGAMACSMGLAGVASAATGFGLDRTNPMTTGCAVNVQTIASKPIYDSSPPSIATPIATLQVRYSPVCHTEWARVINSRWGSNPIEVYVTRDYPHQTTYGDGSDPGPFESSLGPLQIWSNWGQLTVTH